MTPARPFLPRTRTLLAIAALALPLAALAQWQWVDKDGRKVFSDQPPPTSIPDKNILRRPGKSVPAPAEPTAAASAPAGTATGTAQAAPKLTGKDKALEDKKKQQDAAAQEARKAEEERQARTRAENCERAKSAKASYDSGVRIGRTNAKGEREVLDDAARAVDVKRLQGLIDTECAPPRPAPQPGSGAAPKASSAGQ